jgi:small subunit ribosomal protein S2
MPIKKQTKDNKIKTDKAKDKAKDKKEEFNIDIEEMKKAGVNFGHRTSRVHPKMRPYIKGIKNTIHIIDLKETAKKLKQALKFIQKLASEEKIILLVGTKIQIKDIVKNIAEECGLPYVNERWIGGTFTNLNTILKRVEYLKNVEKEKAEGKLEKYTKKERIKINRDFQKLKIKFEGLKTLNRLPDAVLVLDIRKDDLAVKEAKMKEVKSIGICDTNTDPSLVDFPIPANDDAISSVKYILEKVKETILKAKSKKS